MKKLFSILSAFLVSLVAFSQSQTFTKDTSFGGFNFRITRQNNLDATGDSSNCVLFLIDAGQKLGQTPPGGFTGTQYDYDTSLIALAGPHRRIRASGWDGGIPLTDGINRYPVIITMQTGSFPHPSSLNSTIATILTRYKIKKKGLLICGASMGAWAAGLYCVNQPSAGDFSIIQKVKAAFLFEPVDLSDNFGDGTPAFAARYQYFATKGALSSGGKLLAFQQTGGLNGRSHEAVDTMNSYVSGSAQWVSTSIGDGTHGCCFDSVFGGTGAPKKFVVFSTFQDVYQWLLRQGDTTLNIPGNNVAPSASASVSNFGYVLQPASSSTLTGSGTDIDGTISSYAWSQISGPNTATITSPSATSTTVTGLVLGSYVFRLTVTDNLGANGFANVTVNVICSTCVVAIAGPDHTIPYIQAYDSISGQASIGAGLTYQWRLINPDPTAGSVGHIVHPTQAQTFLRILPYNPNGWQYELTVTNGTNTAKDTMVEFISWPNMPNLSGGFHLATAVDTLAIGQMGNPGICKIGDYIIDGANDGWVINGLKTDIFTNGFGGNTFNPGQNILIKAGRYGKILLNFTVGQIHATNSNPLRITNYGGQVECLSFSVTNAVNVEVTGKYLPGISGHPSYTGLDGGWAYRWGTSGIFVDNHWNTLDGAAFNISGYSDSVTVHDVMLGDGTFAGWYTKQNDVPQSEVFNHFRHFKIFKNFTFFTHGEGWYKGSTNCDSCGAGNLIYQHLLQDFDMHDNINAFSGNEIVQIGQMGAGMHLYKGIFYMSAMNRLSTFQDQQDFGGQFDVRQGGIRLDSNIFIRSGEQLLSMFAIRKSGLTWNGDSIVFENNLVSHAFGNIGNYVGASNPTPGTLIVIKRNRIGNHNFKAADVFSDVRGTNTQEVIRTQVAATLAHISVRNNISDNTKTGFFTGFSGSFDTSGNTKVSSIPFPKFANTGFSFYGDSLFVYNCERWIDTIEKTNGDENANLSGQGMKQGQLKTYNLGDWCIDLGFFYRSRINGNQGHMPWPGDSTYWQRWSWNNGGVLSYVPPMDFRLPASDPYQQLGMGLTATSTSNIAPTASAGADQTITLPISSVSVAGSGSDVDGTIASYAWTKISGPGTYTITSPSAQNTTITGLLAGTYVFQLTVTDNLGASGFSNVTITVNPAVIIQQRYNKQFTIIKHQ